MHFGLTFLKHGSKKTCNLLAKKSVVQKKCSKKCQKSTKHLVLGQIWSEIKKKFNKIISEEIEKLHAKKHTKKTRNKTLLAFPPSPVDPQSAQSKISSAGTKGKTWPAKDPESFYKWDLPSPGGGLTNKRLHIFTNMLQTHYGVDDITIIMMATRNYYTSPQIPPNFWPKIGKIGPI